MELKSEHPSQDPDRNTWEMLSRSGYSDTAISYFLKQPNMGCLPDASHVSEMTGTCGDTMKVYLKMDANRIQDARFEVMGCPGAVAAAMAAVDLVRGQTVQESLTLTDRDIYRRLGKIPEQKIHCIRLAVKSLQKAIEEYVDKNDREE